MEYAASYTKTVSGSVTTGTSSEASATADSFSIYKAVMNDGFHLNIQSMNGSVKHEANPDHKASIYVTAFSMYGTSGRVKYLVYSPILSSSNETMSFNLSGASFTHDWTSWGDTGDIINQEDLYTSYTNDLYVRLAISKAGGCNVAWTFNVTSATFTLT